MSKTFFQLFKTKKFEYICLSLVFVFGFLVRLYKINNPIADWHSWRQADTASVSREYVNKGINLLLPTYHDISSIQTGIFNPNGYRMVEFPIYNAIHAVLFTQIGRLSLEVWGRLLTVLTALVTAWFLYLIGKRVLGNWGGILTAFFYLFIPYNIYFTRVILPDPMGVTFGIISLWAFLKFTDRKNSFWLVVSAAFFSLMMLIKPYLGFYIFPIVYIAYREKLLKKLVIFSLIAFVPFFVWRWWIAKFPEGIPFYTWAFNGNLIRFKPSFWYWIFGERLSHLILGSLGVVPFVFGVLNTKVKNLFIHFFLFGALFYVIGVASANVMHDYYQILTIPVIALTLAIGTRYLWTQTVFNKVLSRFVLLVSLLVMMITGWYQIRGNYQINHGEIIDAGKRADQILPKDARVIAPYNGDTAFLYQTNRWGWPAIDDSIDNDIAKGAQYYVSVDLGSPDTKLIESRFTTIEKTDKYIIVNLQKPLKAK